MKSPNALKVVPMQDASVNKDVLPVFVAPAQTNKGSSLMLKTLLKHTVTLILLRWVYAKLKPAMSDLMHLLAVCWHENKFHPYSHAADKTASAKGWLQVNNDAATELRRLKYFNLIAKEFKIDMTTLYSKMNSTKIALANLAQAYAMFKWVSVRWKWNGTQWDYIPLPAASLTKVVSQMAKLNKLAPGWRTDYDYGRQVQFTLYQAAPYFFESDYNIKFVGRFKEDYQTWLTLMKTPEIQNLFATASTMESVASIRSIAELPSANV